MTAGSKIAFNAAGALLAVTGVAFIGVQLATQWGKLELALLDRGLLLLTGACALLYALASVPLALAWAHLLRFFGADAPFAVAVGVYGMTVPAKYIPGNISHLAGRQAMGLARGIDGWSLAKASLYELLLICLAGLLCSLFVLPRFFPGASSAITALLFVSSAGCLAAAIRVLLGRWVLYAYLEQLAFLICSAAIFVALMFFVTGESSLVLRQAAVFGGAFILAWTVGLLTPGAPAGVGVREVVLLASLGPLVSDSELLIAVVVSRLVTIAGDLVFFLLATFLAKHSVEI